MLKQQDSFLICDASGDIIPIGDGSSGFYLGATRHLSLLELSVCRMRPLVLKSEINRDNLMLTVDAMNPDFRDDTGVFLPRGTVHLHRSRFLWHASLFESVRLSNFGKKPVQVTLMYRFGADFKDMFEIRGVPRKARGEMAATVRGQDRIQLAYTGLDNRRRITELSFSLTPSTVTDDAVSFPMELIPGKRCALHFEARTEDSPPSSGSVRRAFFSGYRGLKSTATAMHQSESRIESSNPRFGSWLDRSRSDLHLMLTPTPHGYYPYAGIPWFNTVFGRDGILTALQSLWFNPGIARGVLSYLAANQATEEQPLFDAQPGKILHEVRTGEMVALREVPFEKYYGSIDSTPLFVILAGAYLERTGDTEFILSIWKNVRSALDWIDKHGDLDGDGLYEYEKRSPNGLTNQGWKDSHDCISYANGELAKSPIALCEVQGYVYEAKRKAADMARVAGENELSRRLIAEADALQQRFEKHFWWEEEGTYYMALDGDKRPCKILSSNPGHCLFTGIIGEDRAPLVAKSLMSERLFSGWGIRTLANVEQRYNPMSYHNGSVWPHDTSIAAEGLARYGFKDEALRLTESLFDASMAVDLQRLPELFCGFSRRRAEGPTLYPVACSPQAWASGCAFLMLKACLGLTIRARENRVIFHRPVLPESVETLQLRNMRVGHSEVDLELSRNRGKEASGAVGINILKQTGPVDVSLSRQARFSH